MNLHEGKLKTIENIKGQLPWFVNEFLDVKIKNKRSFDTVYGYASDIHHFLNWNCEQGIFISRTSESVTLYDLEKLSKNEIQEYLNWLEFEMKHSDNTINRKISSLRSLFVYLTVEYEDDDGESYFNRNVMNYIPLRKKTKQTVANEISTIILSGSKTKELLDFIINDYEREDISARQRTSFQKNKNRDITIVSLILESGLRAAEVISLKENDIKWEEKIIIVIRKGEKVLVPISLTALTHLKVHYSKLIKESFLNESKTLFGKNHLGSYTPLSIRSIQLIVEKYTNSFSKSMSPQQLRQSYAVQHWNRNKDALTLLSLLGNSDARILDILTRIKSD